MRLETLNSSTTANVEENAATVLVAGHQEPAGRIHAERGDGASDLQRNQMLIRQTILLLLREWVATTSDKNSIDGERERSDGYVARAGEMAVRLKTATIESLSDAELNARLESNVKMLTNACRVLSYVAKTSSLSVDSHCDFRFERLP